MEPPAKGSIHRGKVARIEQYGAFVEFQPDDDRQSRRPFRGLVHISQLSDQRVENVNDFVTVDGTVWVQVLAVEEQQNSSETGRPPRFKISLTMKDVPQSDDAIELVAQQESQQRVVASLEQSMHSTVGLGLARDPMARVGRDGGNGSSARLLLKSNMASSQQQQLDTINGYTLVDDNEGEIDLEPGPPSVKNAASMASPAPPEACRPSLGRGRGTTLPAWMTKKELPEQQPLGSLLSKDEKGGKKRDSGKNKDERRGRSKKKKKRKKHNRKKSSSRKRYYSDDDESSYEGRNRRQRKHSSRHYSSGDDSDESSHRSRSRKRRKQSSR